MQSIMFMKNLAVAGGFLALAAYGPGALALDNRSRRRGAVTGRA
jgi:putative oxidoreductase